MLAFVPDGLSSHPERGEGSPGRPRFFAALRMTLLCMLILLLAACGRKAGLEVPPGGGAFPQAYPTAQAPDY